MLNYDSLLKIKIKLGLINSKFFILISFVQVVALQQT